MGPCWAVVPERLGLSATCHSRVARLREAGVWDRVLGAASKACDGDVDMIEPSSVRIRRRRRGYPIFRRWGGADRLSRFLNAFELLRVRQCLGMGIPWRRGRDRARAVTLGTASPLLAPAGSKERAVGPALVPDVSAPAVAQRIGISPAQLFGWRRLALVRASAALRTRGEVATDIASSSAPPVDESSIGDAVTNVGAEIGEAALPLVLRRSAIMTRLASNCSWRPNLWGSAPASVQGRRRGKNGKLFRLFRKEKQPMRRRSSQKRSNDTAGPMLSQLNPNERWSFGLVSYQFTDERRSRVLNVDECTRRARRCWRTPHCPACG